MASFILEFYLWSTSGLAMVDNGCHGNTNDAKIQELRFACESAKSPL